MFTHNENLSISRRGKKYPSAPPLASHKNCVNECRRVNTHMYPVSIAQWTEWLS